MLPLHLIEEGTLGSLAIPLSPNSIYLASFPSPSGPLLQARQTIYSHSAAGLYIFIPGALTIFFYFLFAKQSSRVPHKTQLQGLPMEVTSIYQILLSSWALNLNRRARLKNIQTAPKSTINTSHKENQKYQLLLSLVIRCCPSSIENSRIYK